MMRVTNKMIEEKIQQLRSNGVKGPYTMYFAVWPLRIKAIHGRNAKTIWRKYKRYNRKARKHMNMWGEGED